MCLLVGAVAAQQLFIPGSKVTKRNGRVKKPITELCADGVKNQKRCIDDDECVPSGIFVRNLVQNSLWHAFNFCHFYLAMQIEGQGNWGKNWVRLKKFCYRIILIISGTAIPTNLIALRTILVKLLAQASVHRLALPPYQISHAWKLVSSPIQLTAKSTTIVMKVMTVNWQPMSIDAPTCTSSIQAHQEAASVVSLEIASAQLSTAMAEFKTFWWDTVGSQRDLDSMLQLAEVEITNHSSPVAMLV